MDSPQRGTQFPQSSHRRPAPQVAFFKPRQKSWTRKIIWHGSTAFILCGFTWATYATFQNEKSWKSDEYEKLKEYEKLVESYKEQKDDATDSGEQNGMH
mmetsp:Transcript_33392/g.53500  ORF Transcript_33392/g.53500 Transcript_33392/m.53500 type:complete len:99 (+) Transcript_33392:28-324(+)